MDSLDGIAVRSYLWASSHLSPGNWPSKYEYCSKKNENSPDLIACVFSTNS